jgi:phospholipase C
VTDQAVKSSGLSAPDGTAALHERVDHVVVLMLENRSFDHMLGYLSLGERKDVDGLDLARDRNLYRGRTYSPWHLDRLALRDWEDPDHSGDGVARQLADHNGGFVANFIETRPDENRPVLEETDQIVVMGYYAQADVPTYDHLAAQFTICERWFASVPGATWPNRLYALCGESNGSHDNKRLAGKIDWPLYHLPSFVRHLDRAKVSWRWYHARQADLEPPTLQVADAKYLWKLGGGEHYALFDRPEALGRQASFLDDAREGHLQSVSWIDPDFGITKRKESNDDHPPADISHAQALVRKVANAIMEGPQWERTLLVVTYDEHGGFFDHVEPPAAPDDRPNMRRYGPRVPAFVISPYVEPSSVSTLVFDHTSIIRTILDRFCERENPWMGARVGNANSLGRLLERGTPRAKALVPDIEALPAVSPPIDLELPHDEQRRLAIPRSANLAAEPVLEDLANLPPMNDLQLGLVRAGLERRDED